jgi:hypothetical protein
LVVGGGSLKVRGEEGRVGHFELGALGSEVINGGYDVGLPLALEPCSRERDLGDILLGRFEGGGDVDFDPFCFQDGNKPCNRMWDPLKVGYGDVEGFEGAKKTELEGFGSVLEPEGLKVDLLGSVRPFVSQGGDLMPVLDMDAGSRDVGRAVDRGGCFVDKVVLDRHGLVGHLGDNGEVRSEGVGDPVVGFIADSGKNLTEKDGSGSNYGLLRERGCLGSGVSSVYLDQPANANHVSSVLQEVVDLLS